MKLTRFAMLGMSLAMLSCSGQHSTQLEPVSLSGTWVGTFNTGPGMPTQSLNFNLFEDDGVVSGGGTLHPDTSSPRESVALTLSGTYALPNVTLKMSSPGFGTLDLAGSVSSTKITAVLNGSGYVDQKVILTKPAVF